MVRLILSLALLACLFAPGARAQATADQLNKLSLEALTAPPPPGSGGGYGPARHSYARHAYTRPAWQARSRYAAVPRRTWAPRRSYAAARWGHPLAQRHFVAHWTRAPQPHRAATHRVSPYTPKFYRRR